ncbi:5-oxoprolinase-like isoform X2 [Oopsacas minuta]|uniref:5-oxoprolinase-like isoform X2 n=1 Tax=Oopsacas minuta TaxID=111878 RepID=A0AAV7JEC3_9METZ|nr:5-oxoprolinase-like isoform X2 [Oopsacas minuta]
MSSAQSSDSKFHFSIDRGGTFTDVFATCPNGKIHVMKLLSEDTQRYVDAPREAIRRILSQETGVDYPKDKPIPTDLIGNIRMGTTIATNALLERRGTKTALVVTKGFRDLLHIGNQSRPNLFDLSVQTPDNLYSDVIEVDERIVLDNDKCCLELSQNYVSKSTQSGHKVYILQPIDESAVRKDLTDLLQRDIQSLAVVFLHSYLYPQHEIQVGNIAKELGFRNVSLSSSVIAMRKAVPRGFTACADAYLTPGIREYVENFSNGFSDRLRNVNVLFMQSDGGLTPMSEFFGSRAILSGPAGGVVGHAVTTCQLEEEFTDSDSRPRAVIGFDMGGTSTDVSRYAGSYEHVFETTTAGVTIQAPQLDINTVAAGGGSRLFFRNGLLTVGPDSAGANPGPSSYGKHGPLTVTDANLILGRLIPDFFPKIFGKNEDEPLNVSATKVNFDILAEEINSHLSEINSTQMSVEEIAMGFLDVANETMCRPIRALTQGKGFDTSKHVLACFGGAGGQHACSIATKLGIQTVYVHKYSGILSAYGIALADVVEDEQEPCNLAYNEANFKYIDERIGKLTYICVEKLEKKGFTKSNLEITSFLHLRYAGTDHALMCEPFTNIEMSKSSCKLALYKETFLSRYKTEFGFILIEREVFVDDIRVRVSGKSKLPKLPEIHGQSSSVDPVAVTKCYFSRGYIDTPVYNLDNLKSTDSIQGPAIILDQNSTVLIEENCQAIISQNGSIKIDISLSNTSIPSVEGNTIDAVQLSIFSHRFMSIAEQMGRMLQRTSISTNIKERLDFSCALFGRDGGLVANAPHIPVHLGAMQEAVQYQMILHREDMQSGDVFLSNHPSAGGSHLPDLTVITPVFRTGVNEPIFFVASRAHHADIGGLTPGSMPPFSTDISQEGLSVKSFRMIDRGVLLEDKLAELLNQAGTRTLSDNLSDLKAQIAANKKGAILIEELIQEYSLPIVQAYMGHIQSNAETAVREVLKKFAKDFQNRTGRACTESIDHMDDGTPIQLSVEINQNTGDAIFDFTGTGMEVYNNTNAPRAVTLAAIIYCLRAMVGSDIPLNQGCLKPVTLKIPPNTLLSPSDIAAVVGGNVLTSQRIVDVVLKAFNVCAASQGCMNNLTLGDDTHGYYETVAGGVGAGPGWDGRSGTHSHMTNTRITDPEVLEQRYPLILRAFHLNPNTGGDGEFQGGDGVVREIMFRKKLKLCLLTERRVFRPYGMNGGEDGHSGLNILIQTNGRKVNLGGKTAVDVLAGDSLRLCTPGGGGYGDVRDRQTRPVGNIKKHGVLSGSVFEYQKQQESV